MEAKVPNHLTDRILVHINSEHRNVKKETLVLEDLGISQWDTVEAELKKQWVAGLRTVDIKIEIYAVTPALAAHKTGNKRSAQEAEVVGSSPQTATRKTRTSTMLAQRDTRAEAQGDHAELIKKIITRWTCTLSECRNHQHGRKGFCWVDNTGQHYALSVAQHTKWASAIQSGEATVEGPPASLVQDWITNQGAVRIDSKRPLKETNSDRLSKINDQFELVDHRFQRVVNMGLSMAELNLTQGVVTTSRSFAEQRPISPRRRRSSHSLRRRRSSSSSSRSPTPRPRKERQQQHQYRHEQSPYEGAPPPPPPPPPPTTRSSPIDNTQDEVVVTTFFRWKVLRAKTAALRANIERASAIIERECWTSEDLRNMADTASDIYKLAVQEHKLPDGMVRKFRDELHEFKQQYRDGQTLAAMTGGGFVME